MGDDLVKRLRDRISYYGDIHQQAVEAIGRLTQQRDGAIHELRVLSRKVGRLEAEVARLRKERTND